MKNLSSYTKLTEILFRQKGAVHYGIIYLGIKDVQTNAEAEAFGLRAYCAVIGHIAGS